MSDAVNNSPFFIVGCGRSGTTLLRSILASHSRLSIPPETWFLNKMVDLMELRRPLSEQEVGRAVDVITNHYRWPDFELDANDFRAEVFALRNPHFKDVVEVLYRKHMVREGKSRWGDKTPGYIELVPQITEVFNGAQFIHLMRDGRDVAKSFQSQRWNGKWLPDNGREWISAMNWAERWQRSEYAERILAVRYEDLVLDTKTTIQRICGFLNEAFEPQMLDWRVGADGIVPQREMKIHTKLAKAPDVSDLYRWKREMSAREVFVCEALMRKHLRSGGYELRYYSVVWLPLLAIAKLFCATILPIFKALARAVRFVGRTVSRSGQMSSAKGKTVGS